MNDTLAVLAKNVLLLQQVSYRGHLRRLLSVIKMRFSRQDISLREFRLAAATGFIVLTTGESETMFLAEMTLQQERHFGRTFDAGGIEKADEA